MQANKKIHFKGVVTAVKGPTDLGPYRQPIPMIAQVIPNHPLISSLLLESMVGSEADQAVH